MITKAEITKTTLTIEGTGLSPVMPQTSRRPVLKIGGVAFPIQRATDDRIYASVPEGTRGTVTVQAPGGTATGPDVGFIEIKRTKPPVSPSLPTPPVRSNPLL